MDVRFAVVSVLFGLLPESIYFSLFFIFAKKIESRRWLLFGMIFAVNLVLSALFAFSVWYHFLFIFSMYGILWLLYKSHIIEVFLVTVPALILSALGYACYFLIPNYWVAAVINRISMFAIVLAFKSRWNGMYMAYRKSWDIHPGARIKSLTVRNISIIVLNLLLFFINLFLGYFILPK